jgi:hypothetical protein
MELPNNLDTMASQHPRRHCLKCTQPHSTTPLTVFWYLRYL